MLSFVNCAALGADVVDPSGPGASGVVIWSINDFVSGVLGKGFILRVKDSKDAQGRNKMV